MVDDIAEGRNLVTARRFSLILGLNVITEVAAAPGKGVVPGPKISKTLSKLIPLSRQQAHLHLV